MVSGTARQVARLLLLLAAVSSTRPVRAEPPGVVSVVHNGVRGFFVPTEEFVQLERAREELPIVRQQLDLRTEQLQELQRSVRLWTATATTARAQAHANWTFYVDERDAHRATSAQLLELRTRPSWEGPIWALGAAAITAAIAIGIDRARVHETP